MFQIKRVFLWSSAVGVGMALTAAMVAAQNPPDRTNVDQNAEKGRRADSQTGDDKISDRFLAGWLVIANQSEIELAQLAEQHAKNDEVKQFAQQMIQEHQQLLSALQPISGLDVSRSRADDAREKSSGNPRPGTDKSAPQRPGQPRDQNAPGDATSRTDAGRASGVHDTSSNSHAEILNLKQEIAQKCLATFREQATQGGDFDKMFIGQQLMAHYSALDTMEVFQSRASGELRQVIGQGIPVVRKHLEHAKQIMQKLHDESATTAKRPAGNRVE